MIRLGWSVALAGIAAGSASADAFCDDMTAMAGQGATPAFAGMPEQIVCSTSLMLSGETQMQCSWPFAYRSDAAEAAFEMMLADVRVCLGLDAIETNDQDVNHPDFYDLRLFALDEQVIGVSLKDKSSLQETYVSLQVTLP